MTTDTVELMQMIYVVSSEHAQLEAQSMGLLVLVAVLLLWLCCLPIRGRG